jgi:hypothetical protein
LHRYEAHYQSKWSKEGKKVVADRLNFGIGLPAPPRDGSRSIGNMMECFAF